MRSRVCAKIGRARRSLGHPERLLNVPQIVVSRDHTGTIEAFDRHVGHVPFESSDLLRPRVCGFVERLLPAAGLHKPGVTDGFFTRDLRDSTVALLVHLTWTSVESQASSGCLIARAPRADAQHRRHHGDGGANHEHSCLLYTSPSPRD